MSSRRRVQTHPVQPLAQRVAMDAARTVLARQAFGAAALLAARPTRFAGPKGLGGAPALYARNANGQVSEDPVSLQRIPAHRAVKIGKKYFNSRSLRELLRRNPDATNPLTRQPLPEAIKQRFGPRSPENLVADFVHVLEVLDRAESMRRRGAPVARVASLLGAQLDPADPYEPEDDEVMRVFGGPRSEVYFILDPRTMTGVFREVVSDDEDPYQGRVVALYARGAVTVESRGASPLWTAALSAALRRHQKPSGRRLF